MYIVFHQVSNCAPVYVDFIQFIYSKSYGLFVTKVDKWGHHNSPMDTSLAMFINLLWKILVPFYFNGTFKVYVVFYL